MVINFKDKVVLITGGGSGLGRIYALDFASRGASVIVNDIANAPAVAAEIEAAGGAAMASDADITNSSMVAQMVEDILARYGRIDVLINNAGFMRDASFVNLSEEECNQVTEIHLNATMRVTRAVWPIMLSQAYGRILVTTSASGLYGTSGQSHYSAAKLGVVGLINTLKLEGQKFNIRCNAIAPVAYTASTKNLYPAEAEGLMKPEQVSVAAVFLCSEQAPNGAILCAGGGTFTRARIMESQGLALGEDELSAETIARNWEKISDMSDAKSYNMGGEQLGKFFAMAKV